MTPYQKSQPWLMNGSNKPHLVHQMFLQEISDKLSGTSPGVDLTATVTITANELAQDILIMKNLAGTNIFSFASEENGILKINDECGSARITLDSVGPSSINGGALNVTGPLDIGSTIGITGMIDDDTMGTASATTVATSESIKAYVDTQITAEDLDFAGDSGTGSVDLDSQTFTLSGTANEIETVASGKTITFSLPSSVTITTALGVGVSPDTMLHLRGSSTAIIRLDNNDSTLSAGQLIGGLEFEKQDPDGAGIGVVGGVRMRSNSGGTGAYLAFSTGNSVSNDNAVVKIDEDGHVSIGAGAAGIDYKLEFIGENSTGTITHKEDEARFDIDQQITISNPSINATSLTPANALQLGLFVGTPDGSNVTGEIQTGISLGDGYAGMYAIDAGGSAANSLGFFTGDNTAVSEKMRLTNGGNLGIGRSPSHLLDAYNSTGETLINSEVNANSIVGLQITKTGATTQQWQIRDGGSANGELEIYDMTDSVALITFDTDNHISHHKNITDGTATSEGVVHRAPQFQTTTTATTVTLDSFTMQEGYSYNIEFKVICNHNYSATFGTDAPHVWIGKYKSAYGTSAYGTYKLFEIETIHSHDAGSDNVGIDRSGNDIRLRATSSNTFNRRWMGQITYWSVDGYVGEGPPG